ncbi:hypothetical protein TMEC54S_00210 [Thauera mechernichensis]
MHQFYKRGLLGGISIYEVGNAVADPRVTEPLGRIAYDELWTTLGKLVCGIIKDKVSAHLCFTHVVQNSRVAILSTRHTAYSAGQFCWQQCADVIKRLPVAPRAMYDNFAITFSDALPKVIGPAEPLVTYQNQFPLFLLKLEKLWRVEYAIEVDEDDLSFHTSTGENCQSN